MKSKCYMDIKGLDYNTQREKLLMPEYGREIQKRGDYAVELPSREERQPMKVSVPSSIFSRMPIAAFIERSATSHSSPNLAAVNDMRHCTFT